MSVRAAGGGPDGDDTAALVTGVVAALVRELHQRDPPAVDLDSDLERDLGLDSLALAELVARLEDRIRAPLPAALLREGLGAARRMSRLEEIHGEFLAIDAALDALEPGDLCLVLIDQVEEALAHIARRIEPRGDEVDTIPAKEGIVRAHAYP